MDIKFSKGVTGPVKVSNGTYYKEFVGDTPFEVEEAEWPLLRKVRVTVPTGKKSKDGRELTVTLEAFEMIDPAVARPAPARPAPPARPVAADAPGTAESKGGK